MSDHTIKEARRWFAEELRFVARVSAPEVVEAFANVPRERFVGPGPLRILSPWNMKDYWTAARRHRRCRLSRCVDRL